ncbi:MAG: hypothetical protein AMS26_12755 [Bacteroides sp. SM23_62]|nr:MAG: hypothetical protein AMS26_12755 [Bacteroides sp. SM23_62]
MSKKLGILVIRGSGESGFKKQEKFLGKIYRKLDKEGFPADQIHHEMVDWYGPLQVQQESALERIYAANIKLRSRATRRLIVTNIGDLITYGGKPNTQSNGYEDTHKLVHQSMLALKSMLAENAPLVVLAASMGTEIISNYIWDRQHATSPDPLGGSPFERFETLTGLFTFGNNFPIFAAAHDIDAMEPITFPSPNLAPNLLAKAVWENYYDKNDSMGYPIKALNSKYAAANLTDIQINVGNLLTYWNLLSHFGYWRSKKLVRRIAGYIKNIMSDPA